MKPAASRDRQREGLLATSYPQRRGKSDGHRLGCKPVADSIAARGLLTRFGSQAAIDLDLR